MTSRIAPVLQFVVPCYNEEDVIATITQQLVDKLELLAAAGVVSKHSTILFVDDGSTDATWSLIRQAAAGSRLVGGISLAKNYGHQVAVYAGLQEAKTTCDVAISLDADGQDDLDAIEGMLDAYFQGSEIVYAVRMNRDVDPLPKRMTAELYYRALNLLGIETVKGHADFRLVSVRAIDMLEDTLERTPQSSVFLRGVFPQLPLNSATIDYCCKERIAGATKYSPGRMARLAIDGFVCKGWAPVAKSAVSGIALLVPGLALASSKSHVVRGTGIACALAGSALLMLAGIAGARYRQSGKAIYQVAERV